MGSFSAALRRWISGGGGAAKSLGSNRTTYLFTAKRMITSTTTTGAVTSFELSPSPFLLLAPPSDGPDRSITRLYSPATNEIYNFCTEEYSRKITGCDWGILGTSHGWLGFYNSDNHDVLLLDPVTDRTVRLPSMDCAVHALIFVENFAFAVAVAAASSGGRLALCRNGVWTSFPSDKACDSLFYSSRRNRLFCITRDAANNKPNLEIWNLGERDGNTPKCEWEMDLNAELSNRKSNNLKELMYVACAEHSGEVFVVVRHVRITHGFDGSFVDGTVGTEYVGGAFSEPYKTDHFKVYKVDEEGRRLILMKDSLEGMAMFVGSNHPMAIPAKEVAGVKPDSVYFTYDRRIRYWFRRSRDDGSGFYRYGETDNGIYDYIKMKLSPICTYNRCCVPRKPLWFTSPHI